MVPALAGMGEKRRYPVQRLLALVDDNRGMRMAARLALLSLAPMTIGATPAPTFVPLGKYGEGVLVPANSPIMFRQFNEHDSAQFSGRFVLEGVFVLDCDSCEQGYKDNEIRLSMIPDPAIAARLPHWKVHNNDFAIVITNAASFMRSISTPAQRKLLLSGRLDEVRGRAAIVVDDFEAGLDCDSANYSARFVAIAKPPRIAKIHLKGDFGCGMI
jgi:hypothetical protein